MGKLILVTGGVKSGKSSFALSLVKQQEGEVVFVATAMPIDEEMVRRIEKHRKNRPSHWQTVEIKKRLLNEVKHLKGDGLIVDCLTLYLSHLLSLSETLNAKEILSEVIKVADWARRNFSLAIFVTNEVGSGVVPETWLGRQFADVLGQANQAFAEQADEIFLLVAGVPIKIK